MYNQGIMGMEQRKNGLECCRAVAAKKSLRMADLHVEKQISVGKKVETHRRVSDGHNIQTRPVCRGYALYQGSYMNTEGREIQ